MTVLMEHPAEVVNECVIDLENMTWTCTEHAVTMSIGDDVGECPKCAPAYPEYLVDNWTG